MEFQNSVGVPGKPGIFGTNKISDEFSGGDVKISGMDHGDSGN
jgi:hypothetical protein